jgi:hypothetical protein
VLILAIAAAWAGTDARPTETTVSAGGSAGLVAWQTSARHAITPSLGGWATYDSRPWAVSIEAVGGRRVDDGAAYRFRTAQLRADAVGSLSLGTQATSLLLGLGPALTVRNTAVDAADRSRPEDVIAEPVTATRMDVGLRARLALEGPLGEHVAFAWHVGLVTRGAGADWDTAIGLGWRR